MKVEGKESSAGRVQVCSRGSDAEARLEAPIGDEGGSEVWTQRLRVAA